MLLGIRYLVGEIYSEFKYLLESDALDDDEKSLFIQIKKQDILVNEIRLQASLEKLSNYLTRHHNSKCVILIDEYDVPLENAYEKGFVEKAKTFLGNLFSNLLKVNLTCNFSDK